MPFQLATTFRSKTVAEELALALNNIDAVITLELNFRTDNVKV